MANNGFTRRRFLQGAAAAAGLAGASRLTGGRLIESAYAQEAAEKPAVFIFFMRGGYNALFGSADSFLGNGAFGVRDGNVRRIRQSDVYVDRASLGSLSDGALDHMASIGVRHGISAHPAAQKALWNDGNKSWPVQLAAALGGDAAIRCATVGNRVMPGVHRAIGDVSMQQIRDLSTTIAALGGTTRANAPERSLAAGGLAAAHSMSEGSLLVNPSSGASLAEGYPAAVGLLTQEGQAFDYAEMAEAYGIQPRANGTYRTAVGGVRMQFLAAELMIRAGANVVCAENAGWDTHGDRDGSEVRTKMRQRGVTDSLRAFVDRTMAMTGRNVVTVLFGDFSRSLPGSDHQPNLTATVFGKYVKLGTTGRVNRRVGLPAGTPGIRGLWAYISAALKAPEKPFGNNPHGLIL